MRRLTIVLGLALLAGACSAAGHESTSASTGAAPAPTDQTAGNELTAGSRAAPADPGPLRWTSCGEGLECASLTVPIDESAGEGPTIDLAVVRRPATGRAPRVGSLVVNPGGPGGSGIQMVRDGYGTTDGLNDSFDIVSWDPRGVGKSAPLPCAGEVDKFLALDPSPDSPAEQSALDTAARGIAEDCAAHAGPLLDHMGTTNTVDDLEQLRRALGEGKLNFAGYSYGTAIGLGYAERHPDRIRALVLDGVDQPDWSLTDLLGNQADSFERAVTSTFARCDRTASCPVHDAGATYDRVAAALEHAPIPDGSGGVIGPAELAIAATTSVYYPDAAQTFLDGLAAAARGDGSGLLPLVEIYRRESRSYAAYAGVTCVDSPHPVGSEDYRAFAKRLRTQAPRFGATVANEMLPCAFWPAAVTHTPHVVTAPGTPTVVLVGTTGDPATPYASAVSVAGQLSNAVLVTLDGEGHTSGDNRCVAALVRTYLVDLVPPTKDARCG